MQKAGDVMGNDKLEQKGAEKRGEAGGYGGSTGGSGGYGGSSEGYGGSRNDNY